MRNKRILSFALAFVCLLAAGIPVMAAEVDCDDVYCFSTGDFSQEEGELKGICITALPDSDSGTVLLGSRVLRPGDILAANQINQMTFAPLRTEENAQAVISYLPIYENHVAPGATMTLSIRGKEDKAPVAQDIALETYKNLPKEGTLKVSDPEGGKLIFTVVRQPKRGEVVVNADGTFLYTPKKNKVGVDSFVFTATDEAGNVSREATVTIRLLKPTASQYTDTLEEDCRFEAEWLKNTGLFEGENINGESCFQPGKTVGRGEFLAVAVKLLELPLEKDARQLQAVRSAPQWLRPYVAAALRSGMLEGLDLESVGYDSPITGHEAAMMLQNVLDLKVSTAAQLNSEGDNATPQEMALACLAENGVKLLGDQALTRRELAVALYQVKTLSQDAPGMQVIRSQR